MTEYNDGIAVGESTTHFQKYILACNWGIGLATGLGSDLFPESHLEHILSIVFYLCSALFFAFMIAVVDTKLTYYVNHPCVLCCVLCCVVSCPLPLPSPPFATLPSLCHCLALPYLSCVRQSSPQPMLPHASCSLSTHLFPLIT